MARDPICGKEVDELRARGVAIYGRVTYYFCSQEHRAEFTRDPARHATGAGVPVAVTHVESSGRKRGTPARGTPAPAAPVVESPALTGLPTVERPVAEPRDGELLSEATDEPELRPRRSKAWIAVVLLVVAALGVAAFLLLRRR